MPLTDEKCRDRGWLLRLAGAAAILVVACAPARGQAGPPGGGDAAPAAAPSYYAGEGSQPTAPPVEMGLLDTITDSLTGDVYADGRWRPLTVGGLFNEGWLEPWAGAPAGRDGRTPRHGWLGAFDGVFYRLWLTTFGYFNDINTPYHGNRYGGTYSVFLPFSRRFETLLDVPFVTANGTTSPGRGDTSEFGDLTVTPRVLLSETVATTQVFAVGVRTPTGSKATGNGLLALTPRYEFWTNPVGPWVVRGSSGVFVPLNKRDAPAQTAFTGGLAAGRYFRPHDVPFGDLVVYAACNFNIPLEAAAPGATALDVGPGTRSHVTGNAVSVGPGTRFHITNNFFFLNFWDFPVTGPHAYTYNVQVALMKVF